MRIKITFKTPDAVDYVLNSRVCMENPEKSVELMEEAMNTINQFVKYGEVISVEFDTETNTARVIPIKE